MYFLELSRLKNVFCRFFSVKVIQKMLSSTSSGAMVANDCLIHYSVSSLPFGGVGELKQRRL